MIAFLVMETMMVGVFSALDFVLFYLFFEGGLIPMFLIIGVWGGERRVYSTFKFFLYTLLGSVLLLLAMLYMYFAVGTTDIPTLINHGFAPDVQRWLWLAFLASVRRQDPDVAGSYLAARRPCRGADRRFGHPRRRPVEDRRLRLHPLFHSHAAGCDRVLHAADLHPQRRCHHLHLARGAHAGGT